METANQVLFQNTHTFKILGEDEDGSIECKGKAR